jgi:periplasmic protein TonB
MTEPVIRFRAELGSLSQCLVEGDPHDLARARRLRRRTFAASVALQAVCVAAVLILPLIAVPGALPPRFMSTPLPPYRGGGGPVRPNLRHAPSRPIQSLLPHGLIFPTLKAHRRAHGVSGQSAPVVGPAIGDEWTGIGSGPLGGYIGGGASDGGPVRPPHPAAPARPLIRKVSEGVMDGSLIHRVDPVYPEIARAIHLSGTVRLRAIISTDGRVQNLEVLSGNPILANAAVSAVRQWRYRPTLLSGSPVEVETLITVNFVLSQ